MEEKTRIFVVSIRVFSYAYAVSAYSSCFSFFISASVIFFYAKEALVSLNNSFFLFYHTCSSYLFWIILAFFP